MHKLGNIYMRSKVTWNTQVVIVVDKVIDAPNHIKYYGSNIIPLGTQVPSYRKNVLRGIK